MKEQISTIKKKIRGSRGFTLVEALTAILIMLMASSIVVAGIPAARNAYEKVVVASNAEVLLSTTITTLRNELGMADEIELGSGDSAGEITYYNPSVGAYSKISPAPAGGTDPEGTILLSRYAAPPGAAASEASSAPRRLVSKEASTAELYVTYGSVTYNADAGIITFEDLKVLKEKGNVRLAGRPALSIRLIAQ